MKYESPRKIFRDMYKNPDYYPNDFEEQKIIKEELSKDGSRRNNRNKEIVDGKKDELESEKKVEMETTNGRAFQLAVDNILEANLLDGVDNPEELKVIKQRQEVALDYMSKILEDIKKYLNQVSVLQMQKISSYDDINKYQAAVGSSDAMRRSYHNKLISDVKIAMRLININFNIDFPEDLRLKQELQMPDRKGISPENLKNLMTQRKYFKFQFPVGVFIDFNKAPKDPQGEREFIAHWALQLYTDLTALDEKMRETFSNSKKDQLE